MPITRTPQIDDDSSGMTGTVWNNAWKTELYNQIDAWVGSVTVTPYVSGHYYGSGGMPWVVTSGNVLANHYQVVGKMLTWTIALSGTATSGTASNLLNITIPGGFAAAYFSSAFGKIYQASGGWVDVFTNAIGTHVEVEKVGSANYSSPDSNTFVRFQMHIPII